MKDEFISVSEVLRRNKADKEAIELAILTGEEALGENLVWLTDKFDLAIRQKDQEVIARLRALNEAWTNLVRAKNVISRKK